MFSNPFKRAPEPEVELPAPVEPASAQTRAPAETSFEAKAPVSDSAFALLVFATGPAPDAGLEPAPVEVATVALGDDATDLAEVATSPATEAATVSADDEKGSEPRVARPLFVGAFLNGELEVVEVLERGPINFYRANAGGWGDNEWKWVWERATSATQPVAPPDDAFWAPATRFVQDEREYAVYDFDERAPFSDWRSPANDDTFLELIVPLSRALESLQSARLSPHIDPDSLWFENEHLHAFGFCDRGENDALSALSDLSSTLAKAHLAPRATLRLDDVWAALPFSVELKGWARKLERGAFSSIADARSALERFAAPNQTRVHVQTDVGLERDHNEDGVSAFSLRRAGQNRDVAIELLAVADGMGGHEAGEVASQTALDTLQMALLQKQGANWNDNAELLSCGRELIAHVNARVIACNEAPPFSSMRQKPGTTLVFALLLGRRLLVGNVGDSRLYRWSAEHGLELLTKDHSYVQDLLDAGKISPDEAWNHPDGSIITSHIGMTRGLLSDVLLHLVTPGDRIVLVSDGVVDTLRDTQIEQVIAQASDVRTLCSRLVDAANEAGGVDNISVAALFCE